MAGVPGDVPYGSIFTQPYIPLGWKCPSCGRCYSPFMVMCAYCPAERTGVTGTTTVPHDNTWKNEQGYMTACPSCGRCPCAHTHTGCRPPDEFVHIHIG